ncbi:hypothetical protein pdam_00018086 [Pocillopora damicornis]|uniref:Uncharacterized protein n=1 Tax=Pocillopora damicornis TaxID=46731 RepID=A0A3M6V6J1_POCDA|nr:hypothetical protein pdam_00018086 [Pocillopora damicornis]
MQSHCDTKDFLCLYLSGDGTPIRIFAPINHGNKLSGIRELAFIWIEACIVQSGKNLEGNSIMIDWFAFQGSQSGVSHGQAIFSLTTIGSHCNRSFTSIPKIHVTLQHGTLNQVQDANVSTNYLEVCLQESTTFDGLHDKLQ